MNSEKIFIEALQYEIKIRDLYVSAQDIVDDERGKKIFNALAVDEQSHVDFIEYSLEILKARGQIDITKLETCIPSKEKFEDEIEKMRKKIPERILGDVKRVLNAALKLEIETSRFYEDACEKTQGPIKEIFNKLLEIEKRHEDVVQIELDHASNNGYWFNFMEIDMEHG
ncbi:MAG: rubrerythrin [Desulfobacula sp.]|jgi:rubrerythrin|uniref:ferritin family protein n=2 Tax=Desulfobacula sp. TaxID=2593537 RepID=UPI001DA11945|nr:rubrerythrin [Desulfobacula sp.]MBT3486581.1 rubrerythrin [Desulfobacula sp.]MBT3805760.1 rubrerythrin [Desulfobacula sp.]MBT4023943.1 rubrerythrin [Desulfobacula sp.]MBT4200349.1 rubrerythrin [Desulfobacula sp.]